MFGKKSQKKFTFIALLGLIALAFSLHYFQTHKENPSLKQKTFVIGIVMPMDHAALRKIVAGFKNTLEKTEEKTENSTNQNIVVQVQNAQGDMNLQRSIIQQFINQKVDIIVPIGTAATQMTASLVKNCPILSLASRYTPKQNSLNSSLMMTNVMDEIGSKKPISLLKEMIPQLKKITLIHSAAEKIFPEVEELDSLSNEMNFSVQKLMIHSLSDLYTVNQHLSKDSDAVFILKDHLVVSGISTVIQQAKKLNLPVIASDEGSVMQGAAFALGVSETEIGKEGAILAKKLLSGEKASKIPPQVIQNLSVFYNEKACVAQGIDFEKLRSHAQQLGYTPVAVTSEGGKQ